MHKQPRFVAYSQKMPLSGFPAQRVYEVLNYTWGRLTPFGMHEPFVTVRLGGPSGVIETRPARLFQLVPR